MKNIIYLNEKNVQDIIAQHFKVDPTKVKLVVSRGIFGYGMNEYEKTYFKHAEVEISNDD